MTLRCSFCPGFVSRSPWGVTSVTGFSPERIEGHCSADLLRGGNLTLYGISLLCSRTGNTGNTRQLGWKFFADGVFDACPFQAKEPLVSPPNPHDLG